MIRPTNLLGVNGTAEAAARLRIVLAKENDPDVIGNAILALSRCPSSPDNLAAVKLRLRVAGQADLAYRQGRDVRQLPGRLCAELPGRDPAPHLVCHYMVDTGLSLFHEGHRIGGITRPERAG